jgi:thiol-disulfide isomerase/thioredoxin
MTAVRKMAKAAWWILTGIIAALIATVTFILEGGFGSAVVMVYADWCVHCRNMMPAFEAAAAKSNVPFVRIQGQTAPVTSSKHKVFGYPTVLGVKSNGEVVRFNESRTEENLLKFASELGDAAPTVIAVAPEIIPSEPLNT